MTKHWSSASVLTVNIHGWFPLGMTGLISLLSKGQESSLALKFFTAQPPLWSNSHPYMTTRKIIALIRPTFVGKVMFLLFNMLSRFVIAFLPRSKGLLILWLQSPSAVILEPKKIKSLNGNHFLISQGGACAHLVKMCSDLDPEGSKCWRHQRRPIQSLRGNTPLASLWQGIQLWDRGVGM